ncbi:MAG TPA: ABC transporter permease subunit [Candidatus Saccharimonadales bacterium]
MRNILHQTVIARFVARRSFRGAALWALAFGVMVASKATGFASAYPTEAERAKLAATFGNNIGLNALLGVPHQITSVKGFAVWNSLGIVMLIGAIWGFLLATRNFRGEEDSGRWEVLLSGGTTARRATVNTLLGLAASLVVLYAVAAAIFISVGQMKQIDYSAQGALFFALAVVTAPLMFIALGAFASQLMPIRAKAAALCAGVFGLSFFVRVIADVTSLHWLLDFTPLGWIEQLRPLYDSQPIWLVPIALWTLGFAAAAVYLSGKRDLGASIIPDADSAEPRTRLLNSPLGAAVRLTRTTDAAWIIGLTIFAGFFGLLAKSAAQAFAQSAATQQIFSRLANSSQQIGATAFLGVIFLLLMTLLMSYVASAIGAAREDEAEGYLDNMLVRPVGRLQWLTGRIVLVAGVIVAVGLLSPCAVWLSQASQHLGLSYHILLEAGLNVMAPAAFSLGFAVFVMGFLPRLTTTLSYSLIAWSFLLQMLSSGINLNHWLLDTSLLHHVALTPASSPNWHVNAVLVGIGLALGLGGLARFYRRDLQTA